MFQCCAQGHGKMAATSIMAQTSEEDIKMRNRSGKSSAGRVITPAQTSFPLSCARSHVDVPLVLSYNVLRFWVVLIRVHNPSPPVAKHTAAYTSSTI